MIGVDPKDLEAFERKVAALCFQCGIVTGDFHGKVTIHFREGGSYGIDRKETERFGKILTRESLGFGDGESTG